MRKAASKGLQQAMDGPRGWAGCHRRRRWAAGVPGASDRHYGTPRLSCSDRRAARRTWAAVGPLCAAALLLVTPGALLPAAGRAAPCFLPIARPRAPLGPPDQVLRSTVPFCSRRSPPISQSDAWMGSNCGERRAAALLCRRPPSWRRWQRRRSLSRLPSRLAAGRHTHCSVLWKFPHASIRLGHSSLVTRHPAGPAAGGGGGSRPVGP